MSFDYQYYGDIIPWKRKPLFWLTPDLIWFFLVYPRPIYICQTTISNSYPQKVIGSTSFSFRSKNISQRSLHIIQALTQNIFSHKKILKYKLITVTFWTIHLWQRKVVCLKVNIKIRSQHIQPHVKLSTQILGYCIVHHYEVGLLVFQIKCPLCEIKARQNKYIFFDKYVFFLERIMNLAMASPLGCTNLMFFSFSKLFHLFNFFKLDWLFTI